MMSTELSSISSWRRMLFIASLAIYHQSNTQNCGTAFTNVPFVRSAKSHFANSQRRQSDIPLVLNGGDGISKLASFSLFMSAEKGGESESATDAPPPAVKQGDGEALQALFMRVCDEDGLMSKDILEGVPVIRELLADEELLLDELNDIWNVAPKFPDGPDEKERIDVDSFIQIYRDIDDLFEDDDDEEEESAPVLAAPEEGDIASKAKSNDAESAPVVSSPAPEAEKENESAASEPIATEDDAVVEKDERELEIAFKTICDDTGLVTKEALQNWDEISQLLTENMLGDDEFEDMWRLTSKSPGESDKIDVDGFLSFNVALDDLFVFEDEEGEEAEIVADDTANGAGSTLEKEAADSNSSLKQLVTEYDLPPSVIFSQLSYGDGYVIEYDDLKRWNELQEMIDSGDLLPLELQSMYASVAKVQDDKIDEEAFLVLYDKIDALFEEETEEEAELKKQKPKSAKSTLFSLLSKYNNIMNEEEERLPCGLEYTAQEQNRILEVVTALETEPMNKIIEQGADLEVVELNGKWELIYTSSGMMVFNKGLSGLGGSIPNGKFGGLTQVLKNSRFTSETEYTESILVTPETSSFDVTVTGDWELKSSVSLFTGQPSVILSVEPEMVTYGPTSTRADHWKSVRSMNLLDLSYLDGDLRVMRGNTSKDTLFVFQKI